MILRGIDFGKVWGASGVQGFFGEGYWFHKLPFGPDFSGVAFVAKTTTYRAREGNMPLMSDFTPRELLPRCIVVNHRKGVALNAVGLSGPGARALFDQNKWQKRREPFFISFMSVSQDPEIRLAELKLFVEMFGEYRHRFRAPVGLQINYSCPNVGLHAGELIDEVEEGLDIASDLQIPLVPKFNVVLPIDVAVMVSRCLYCDALCVSNTIPWGQLPDRIDWFELFGTNESPLAHLGGGGLSGRPLLPILLDWLMAARQAGITKPINAGGGILSLGDARAVMWQGANSVFLGSIAFLRPWRIQKIVRSL